MKYWANNYFEIAVREGERELEYDVEATPWSLRLVSTAGAASIAFVDEDTLHFHSEGLEIALLPVLPMDYHFVDSRGTLTVYTFNGFATHQLRAGEKTVLTCDSGKGPSSAPAQIRAAGSTVDVVLAVRSCEMAWADPVEPAAVVMERAQRQFARWMERRPRTPDEFSSLASTAWFVLWNLRVPQTGIYTRSPVLMNKSSMAQVWGWDNCFVALATIDADPQLAWDQIHLFFDQQYPTGMLPNAINDNYLTTGWTSPPVYGWAMLKMIERQGVDAARPHLAALYEPLGKCVRWWLEFRDHDHDGLCNYIQGNDSGWDNTTLFDDGDFVTGSDLAAYLIFNFDCLACIADVLDRRDEAQSWRQQSDVMLQRLLQHCVADNRLVSVRSGSLQPIASQSLLNYLPLILGDRLPGEIRGRMIDDLREGGPYLTRYGYATEPPSGAKYEPNGYWRGPIWAPSTYLLYDALQRCGERALAREVALRYCRLCERSPGFFENYDALTGAGQYATGFAWTAAVASLLTRELAEK